MKLEKFLLQILLICGNITVRFNNWFFKIDLSIEKNTITGIPTVTCNYTN